MKPYYEDTKAGIVIYHGDCRDVLPTLGQVDALVCDPPYGLSFMGKGWDHGVPGVEFWEAAMGAVKPGAHLLAFGGTRTFHRLAVAIEDAGWEIRDTIMWVYGSGFPKSLDVSKAIDAAAGAEREVVGEHRRGTGNVGDGTGTYNFRGRDVANGSANMEQLVPITAPATPEAAQWQGWGTALKPAWEPIIVARKPLAGTVAANVLKHGTGGINVDACRIGTQKRVPGGISQQKPNAVVYGRYGIETGDEGGHNPDIGRWPANLIHDGSDEVTALFPETSSGVMVAGTQRSTGGGYHGNFPGMATLQDTPGDSGSAARFFYCAKASREDREEGLANLPARTAGESTDRIDGSAGLNSPRAGASRTNGARNFHPTVKPTSLMRYLVRLVTPPGGIVLDPFMGSGSTGKAAILEGFGFVGIDTEADYLPIAQARLEWALAQPRQAALFRQEALPS